MVQNYSHSRQVFLVLRARNY